MNQIPYQEFRARLKSQGTLYEFKPELYFRRAYDEGHPLSLKPEEPKKPAPPPGNPQRTWGLILLIISILSAGFFFAFFDTTVRSSYDGTRIHNQGLLQTQQNGLLISLAGFIGAVVLLATAKPKKQD